MSKILHIWSQRQIGFYVLNICVLTSYYTVHVRWVHSFVNVGVCHKAQMNLLNIFSSWLCTAILNFFNRQDARNIVLYLVTIWHFLLKFYHLICKMQEISFFIWSQFDFFAKILPFNLQDARNIVLYLVTIWNFLLKFYHLKCQMQKIMFFL